MVESGAHSGYPGSSTNDLKAQMSFSFGNNKSNLMKGGKDGARQSKQDGGPLIMAVGGSMSVRNSQATRSVANRNIVNK